MIITFGKHKGKEVKDLPTDYLSWGAENLTNAEMKSAFQSELKRRNVVRNTPAVYGPASNKRWPTSKFQRPQVEPQAPSPDLIFGKDKTENIVSLEVQDDKLHIFREVAGKIIQETRKNQLWLVTDQQYSSKLLPLKGNNHYKYIAYFDTYKDFQEVKGILRGKKRDFYVMNNVRENAAVINGITYYKGMKVSDISILSTDIETNGFAHNDDSLVYCISNTFRSQGKTEKKLFSLDDYDSCIEMLEDWCLWVRTKDPSIICGHNVFMFDFPFLNFVFNHHRGENLPLGRDGSPMMVNTWPSKKRKDGSQEYEFFDAKIFGREIVDTFFLALMYDAATRKYVSYGLKQIIKQEGLEKTGRTFVDAGKISEYWKDEKMRAKVKEYALDDSDDALKLFDLMIPAYFYLNQSMSKSLQAIINSATGSWINSFLIRSYIQNGEAIPKASDIENSYVEGGISFAVPGLYKNILKVDIKACYPSQILRFKMFDPRKDPRGHFYEMVKYFTLERFELKKKYKETKDKYYYDRDQASKVVINSAYGVLNTQGINFNNAQLAAKITEESRKVIDMALNWASGKGVEYWMSEFRKKTGKEEVEEEIEDDAS